MNTSKWIGFILRLAVGLVSMNWICNAIGKDIINYIHDE